MVGHGGYYYSFIMFLVMFIQFYSGFHHCFLIFLSFSLFFLYDSSFYHYLYYSASSFASSASCSLNRNHQNYTFKFPADMRYVFSSDQISNQQRLCSGTKALFRRLHQMSLHRLPQGLVRPGKWHTRDAGSVH